MPRTYQDGHAGRRRSFESGIAEKIVRPLFRPSGCVLVHSHHSLSPPPSERHLLSRHEIKYISSCFINFKMLESTMNPITISSSFPNMTPREVSPSFFSDSSFYGDVLKGHNSGVKSLSLITCSNNKSVAIDAVSDTSSVGSKRKLPEFTDAEQQQPQSTAKRAKTLATTPIVSRSALHKACRRGAHLTLQELEDILTTDPSAPYRPVRLTTTKNVYNPITFQAEPKVVREPYKYALNLAIAYRASPQVLERLIAAAPPVLSLRDNNSCSLHILLKHKPTDATCLDVMLLTRPEAASWVDAKSNTALHTAVRNGAHLGSIRHMVTVYPGALEQRNYYGYTALDLAQQHTVTCSTDVVDFLIELQCQQQQEDGNDDDAGFEEAK